MTGGGREKKEPSVLIFLLLMCVTDEVEWVSVSVSLHSGVEQVPQIWVIWGVAERGVMGRAEERQILKAGVGSNWEKGAAAGLFLSPACSYFIFANSRAEHGSRYWVWFNGARCPLLARGPQAFQAYLCSHFMLVMLFSVISLACPCFLRFIQLLCLSFPALLEMFPSLLLCLFRARNAGT